MKNSSPQKKIDLEKVIRDKNPRLLKWLPYFLLRYMKRIVHEDEFNAFLDRTKDEMDHAFVTAALQDFEITVLSEGLENLPETGGCIVACNHPLGGIDGIAVMSEVARKRKDIKAIVNDILMNLENLNSLLVPVNKHGKNVAQRAKELDAAYASEGCTIVFPAGLVSRKQKRKIVDMEWKKSFISKAIKYDRPIVPVFIDSRNSDFFYNLSIIRKRVGIKANLEMFYLVNETYKQRGKTIRLIFGEPIAPSSLTSDHSAYDWAQKIKTMVYELGDKNKR